MRLIYFRGHPDEAGSALVCRVCRDYETVSRLLDGECATRTLSNLYNLHTVRGAVVAGKLRARTAMSGPHHYLGWIDPTQWCVLVEDGRGGWAYQYAAPPPSRRDLRAIPPGHIHAAGGYRWVRGDSLTRAARLGYRVGSELVKELRDQAGQRDSLFDSPGVLEMDAAQLELQPLQDAWRHDLSSFRVQVVPNGQPWRFDQHLVTTRGRA